MQKKPDIQVMNKYKPKLCLDNANSHKISPSQLTTLRVLKKMCISHGSYTSGFPFSKTRWSGSLETEQAPRSLKANLMTLPSVYKGRDPLLFQVSERRNKSQLIFLTITLNAFTPFSSITSVHSDFPTWKPFCNSHNTHLLILIPGKTFSLTMM